MFKKLLSTDQKSPNKTTINSQPIEWSPIPGSHTALPETNEINLFNVAPLQEIFYNDFAINAFSTTGNEATSPTSSEHHDTLDLFSESDDTPDTTISTDLSDAYPSSENTLLEGKFLIALDSQSTSTHYSIQMEDKSTHDTFGFLRELSDTDLELPDSFTLRTTEFNFHPCLLVEEKKLINNIRSFDVDEFIASFNPDIVPAPLRKDETFIIEHNTLPDFISSSQNETTNKNLPLPSFILITSEAEEKNESSISHYTREEVDALRSINIAPSDFKDYAFAFLKAEAAFSRQAC